MRHLNLKHALPGQAGFILPTAMVVLLIVAMLTGVAISVAVQSSTSTTRDNSTKAALEAAEAGVRAATFRLNALKPAEAQCVTGSGVAAPTGGYCEDAAAESLGNSATFRYWTTPALKAAESCAGQVVEIKSGITQRCVTSQGTVSGISQRLAARVEAAAAQSLFPAKGITGLTEVKISGAVKVPAVVASNEKIIGEGSAAFERGFELCPPKGTFTPKAGAERNASGVTVGGVGGMLANPPLEKERSASECPITAQLPTTHATAETNEDSRIGVQDEFFTGGKAVNKFTGAPNYELVLSSTSKLTLGGSKYYLCKFQAERAAKLIIPVGAHVEIFIDSPEDKASKCPAGTGTFETGEFTLENQAKNPAALLVVMYGKGPFNITRGASFEGSIYAPEAEVTVNGGTTFKGGIVGNKVHLTNGAGVFEWSEEDAFLTNGEPGAYKRKAWEQCTPGAGPKEGC